MGNINFWHVLILLAVLIFLVAAISLFISALISISRSPATGSEKALWVLIVLFFPIIGAFVWFIVGANAIGGRKPQQAPE